VQEHSFIANLSIRTKILSAFAGVLLLLAGTCATALERLSNINATVEDVTSNYMLALEYLSQMEISVETFRRLVVLEVLQADDKSARQSVQGKLAEQVKIYQQNEEKYRPTIGSDAETKLYAQISTASADYLAGFNHLEQLLDAGDRPAGLAYMTTQLRASGDRLSAALQSDLAFNVDEGARRAAEATDTYKTGRLVVIGLLVAGVLLAGLACLFLIRGIAAPIREMTDTMRRLAARDMSAEIPALGRADEVGQMADAVRVFKDGLIEAERLAHAQSAEQGSKEQRARRLDQTIAGFEVSSRDLVGQLSGGASRLEGTATTMASTAERTQQQASAVASSAEQAGAGVQTAAAAAEQLSASISEISRQVSQSTTIAARAVSDAQRTNAQVSALAEAADKIGNVVGLITNIAGQTNLLALNATIEAARAGDAGKGFAVVASEVKNLANQTGRATEEIGQQITQIQAATKEAVAAIRGIATTIEEVSAISTSIAAAVEEQGAATAEIARNVQQTAASASEVSGTIGEVGRAARDTGAAAGQVLGAAKTLSEQAERLAADVNRFVADVRAA
jgi:methyl-accepting chemotaxis protein